MILDRSYRLDGVSLDDAAGRWFLEKATSLPGAAARRTQTLEVARRNGVTVARQGWGTGSVSVSVAVTDKDVSGVRRGAAQLDQNVRVVQALLARAEQITHVSLAAVERTTDVVSVSVSEPSMLGREVQKIEATLTVQPFWQEGDVRIQEVVLTNGALKFSVWDGCTAPVQDGLIRITGPFTTCTLSGRGSVVLSTALAAAKFLYIDPAAFTAFTSSSAAWPSSGAAYALDFGARPLELDCAGGLQLTAAGTGFTSASKIAVRGHLYML